MEDLSYFLNKPGFLDKIETPAVARSGRVSLPRRMLRGVPSLVRLRRQPVLLVVTEWNTHTSRELRPEDAIGCSLVYEYRALGMSMKAAATNDRSGRSTLIAEDGRKADVANACIRALLKRGIHLIMMSTLEDNQGNTLERSSAPDLLSLDLGRCGVRWAARSRSVAAYLPLAETYQATLARLGQKTRSNLRYYRKRAEAELGCVFVPEAGVGEEEFLALNQACMYPVSLRVAQWRYASMSRIGSPFLYGMRDREGGWLSLVGGRRTSFGSEILWQMNRDGLPTYSLSTVMRSYLIEHEIGRGVSRLYVEGGTGHSMRNSFAEEKLVDVLVIRRSASAGLLRLLAGRLVPAGNDLVSMLSQKDVEWQLA